MKNIGIWLDKRNAHIVRLSPNDAKMQTIDSEMDSYNIGGGSGTRFKGGPQDVVHDSKYLAHEQKQLKAYFSKIIEALDEVDQLGLFGPAEAAQMFAKELKAHHKELSAKVVTLQKADSMTENQIKALVRDYFKNNHE